VRLMATGLGAKQGTNSKCELRYKPEQMMGTKHNMRGMRYANETPKSLRTNGMKGKQDQSLSRKSQSIAESCSGALREHPNSLWKNSLWTTSGLDV